MKKSAVRVSSDVEGMDGVGGILFLNLIKLSCIAITLESVDHIQRVPCNIQ